MQNEIDESFWDGLGVEIGACANFTDFPGIRDNFPDPKKNAGSEKKSLIGCTGLAVGGPGPRSTPGAGGLEAEGLPELCEKLSSRVIITSFWINL